MSVTCPYCGKEVRLVPFGYGWAGVCQCGGMYVGSRNGGSWERNFIPRKDDTVVEPE